MDENKNTTSTKETTSEKVTQENIVASPEATREVPTLGFNENGVMGSTTTKVDKTKSKKEINTDIVEVSKVALYSVRNLYAEGFGKINVGYNIIPKKHVEFWVSQKGVRLATPEEVAEVFG